MAISPESTAGGAQVIPVLELADFETDHALDLTAKVEELQLPDPYGSVKLKCEKFDFHTWNARESLSLMLKPSGMHGNLSPVTVTPIADPHTSLLNSAQRGVTRLEGLQTAKRQSREEINQILMRELSVGFDLDYEIKIRGMSGYLVKCEVYLVPIPFLFKRDRDGAITPLRQITETFGGLPVGRVVMKPQPSQEALEMHARGYGGTLAGRRKGAVKKASNPTFKSKGLN